MNISPQKPCRCGKPVRSEGQRYCLACHAAAQQRLRKRHELTPEQRLKGNCRAYAREYLRRGKLIPRPCEVAGCAAKPEMHHEDYSQPLQVRWMCRDHHLKHHEKLHVKQHAEIRYINDRVN